MAVYYRIFLSGDAAMIKPWKYWSWREFLGHFLFMATTFNWLQLFVLMWWFDHVFVSEKHIILLIEIPLGALAFGYSIYWYVVRSRQFKVWHVMFHGKDN